MAGIAVLLGAGASRDAGLPDVSGLVQTFLTNKKVPHRRLLRGIHDALAKQRATTGPDDTVDVELLLDALDQLAQRSTQVLSAFVSDRGWTKAAIGTREQYAAIRDALYAHIRQQLSLSVERVDYYGALIDLAVVHGGVDIFSLNYDLAVELACLAKAEPWTDGFDPRWNPAQFTEIVERTSERRFMIRLHKMHGSLLWHRLNDGTIEKVAVSSDRPAGIRHFSGSKLEEALIYPASGGKDVHTDPYATLVERFRSVLREVDTLICIGYSFRDRHIKSVVTEALVVHPELRMVIVDPSADQALSRSDVSTLARTAFADVSGQIQILPMTTRDALERGALRNLLGDLTTLRSAESSLRSARREQALSTAQGAAQNVVNAARGTPNGHALALLLKDVPEGLFARATDGILRSAPSSSEMLFEKVALAAVGRPDLQPRALVALGRSIRWLARGMYLGTASGDGRGQVVWPPTSADALSTGYRDRDVAGFAKFLTAQIRLIAGARGALLNAKRSCLFHLGADRDDVEVLWRRVFDDLTDAQTFFEICESSNANGSAMQPVHVAHAYPDARAGFPVFFTPEALRFADKHRGTWIGRGSFLVEEAS